MGTPSSTFTIRPAQPADKPAIIGLYNWAINQTFATVDAEPLSEEEAVHWWETQIRGAVTFVADEEGDVIGWTRLLPWSQRGYHVVEDLVYVDPVYQGQGIGQALLTRAIEAARETGCRTIVATVAADNTPGLRLHRGLGFEVVGTIRHAAFKFGRWMDLTLVQRSLD